MKPYFVTCHIPSINIDGRERLNHAVNLCHCRAMLKGMRYGGEDKLPTIEFDGCGIMWIYESEEERDLQFENILFMSR